MRGSLEEALGDGMPSAPEEGGGDELADAMADLGEALADKDWSAAASAFRRAKTLCADDDYEDEIEEG